MANNRVEWPKISFIVMSCLSFYGIALASLSGKDFNIPSQYGTIKESFSAPGANQDAKPVIIHIQDAHCNYEAQKNMSGLLDYLVKNQNLKLIMVEGGSGDVDLSFLRGYADKKARVEVADKYLKEGKISGEEYLDIVSDYPLQLYGIEDQALYDAHMAAFQQVDSFREKGIKDLESLANIIKVLKPLIYSEELRQLEEKKSQYDDKSLSLVEYCKYLSGMANKKKLNLEDYPHLAAFSDVARLEKEISFSQAESQRDAFIKELAKLLDERGVQNLILMTQGFKAKMITPEKYYSFLRDAGEEKLDLSRKYPQLAAYIQYVTTSKDVDVADLLKEISAIEEKIEDASFSNSEQRRLAEITKSLQILTKALNLELTPEDYEYFQTNKAQLSTASWIDFLAQNCNKYNISIQPSAAKLIDENLKQLEEFYKIGLEREGAFVKNMEQKINDSNEKTVVLITGGFHTPGVTRMLKNKGYSYMVMTPAITQKGDSSIYFSVLRGEKNQLEKALNREE